MAVSWVVWGTIDDVRDAMDDYRSSCWEWVSFHRRLPIDGGREWYEVRGEELQTRQPTSVSAIGMLEACRDDPRETAKRMTVKCAREDLWRLLGEGELDASGLNPAGQISEIPAHEWSYLELASKLNGADYLVFSHDTAKSAYSKVTISRARLLEQWPARSEPQPLEKGERNVQLDAKRRKLEATRHALLDLYPGGVPSGLTDKQRLDAVNRWHRQKGNTEVSTTTIRRALAGM